MERPWEVRMLTDDLLRTLVVASTKDRLNTQAIREELGKTDIVSNTQNCTLRRKSHVQTTEETPYIKRDFRHKHSNNGQLHDNLWAGELSRYSDWLRAGRSGD
jgi:hypothetical protein